MNALTSQLAAVASNKHPDEQVCARQRSRAEAGDVGLLHLASTLPQWSRPTPSPE